MKSILTFGLIAIVSASTAFAQDQKTETRQAPWFDMESCEICKCMADHKDMMQHIKWETHLLPNGLLSISVIPDKMKPAMKAVKKEMETSIKKLESGEHVKCCGFCQSMGSLIESGATKKEIDSVGGNIMLLTSNDPAIVKQIHAHANKTIEETKKMQKMMEGLNPGKSDFRKGKGE